MSIFKNENGNWSSKRTMGIIYMVMCLIIFSVKEFRNSVINNPEIFIGMVVTGASLLGIAIFEYFSKFRK